MLREKFRGLLRELLDQVANYYGDRLVTCYVGTAS